MRLLWPFRHEPVRCRIDEGTVSETRAELVLAELALDAARAAYLGLRESRQPANLRRQQCVLDEALHRYHRVRHALRALQQAEVAHATETARRRPIPSRASQ